MGDGFLERYVCLLVSEREEQIIMDEQITTDIILNRLEDAVAAHEIIPPHKWLDAAQALNALLGNEHDILVQLELDVNRSRLATLNEMEKPSVARADLETRATELYRDYQLQKAKIGRIEEMIRISKKQATLRSEELGNY